MNELVKRDLKKGELQYLNGIQDIQKKHMDLLTDLLQRPTLGKEITDITDRKETLLNGDLIHSELKSQYKKFEDISKEKTE